MKNRIALLAAMTLVATACGSELANEPDTRALSRAPTTATTLTRPLAAGTWSLDASTARDPIVEPVVLPPVPIPAPASKPARPNPPTPPPPRSRPDRLDHFPAMPRVPPGVEVPVPVAIPPEDGRVVAAISDLEIRLGVESVDIEILDARDVTWRDGSLGCPQPGLAYGQVLVPGSLIVLRVGESSYRYHSSGDLMPFFCPTPQAPLEGSA